MSDLEERCAEAGLKMTGQRKVIAQVLSSANDHPDVEMLYDRANKVDSKVASSKGSFWKGVIRVLQRGVWYLSLG